MKKLFAIIFTLFLLAGCQTTENSDTGGSTPGGGVSHSYSGFGVVQGGPPQIGSVVTAHCMEFNSTLGEYASTGVNYPAQTDNMFGRFSFANINCPIAKFAFTGFIYNEITNQYEQVSISMFTLIDLSAATSYNINPLSSAITKCVETRRAAGDTDDEAKDYAELKLLEAFGITDIPDPEFEEMDLGGNSLQDVVHVVLTMNMLRNGKNNRTMQDFTQFLSLFQNDFKDCQIDSTTIQDSIRNSARYLPIDTVVTNLTNFYASGGETFSITAAQIRDYAYATDTVKPTVTSISPANSATEVGISSNVVVTFDMPVKESQLTFSSNSTCTGTVQISDGSNCAPITAYSLDQYKEILTLTATLEYGKSYTVKLDPTLQSVSGNAFADTGLQTLGSFTTTYWSGTQQAGTSGDDFGYSIAIDASDNIYLTGKKNNDIFLAKYNFAGIEQWTKTIDSGGWDSGVGIALDSSGNIYLTGDTTGHLDGQDLGSGWSDDSMYDLFASKYDNSGNLSWTRLIGNHQSQYSTGIFVDGSGNVFTSGYSYTAWTLFDFYTHVNDYTQASIFGKYDSSGSIQWVGMTGAGTGFNTDIHAIAIDSSGNIYLAGNTKGVLNGSNTGGSDLFIIKLDTAHNVLWTKQTGTALWELGRDLLVDSTGKIYVIGYNQTNDMGSDADLIIWGLDGSGNESFNNTISSGGFGYALTVNGSGIHVTGKTNDGKILYKRLDKTTGAELYSADLGPGTGHDIKINSQGKVFIVGANTGGLGGNDIFLMQVD